MIDLSKFGAKKMGALIWIAGVGLCLAIGFGVSKYQGKDDGSVEEMAETAAEDMAEAALGLENNELKGKFDVTPKTPESK